MKIAQGSGINPATSSLRVVYGSVSTYICNMAYMYVPGDGGMYYGPPNSYTIYMQPGFSCLSGYYTPSVASCNSDEIMTYCTTTISGPRSCSGVSSVAYCAK
jgi:hypothetical protein